MHHYPTRRVFSGTGLKLVTRLATIRYLYHSGTAAIQKPFKGRQSVNSDPRSGRPSTSRNEDKIAQMKAVVLSDRRLTVREIAQECHISVGSCDEILRKDLNMRQVSAKFVPRLLTENLRISNSND
ncbi:HTH_48 domain-containing protein [Trichonephila clavipes]|nr:HTH_48 domain-containing protein [Trichonephila clavipes]